MNLIKRIIKNVVLPIFTALLIASMITNYVARLVIVDGSSMNPTLHSGDLGITRVVNNKEDIKRGEIVVIKPEKENRHIIKRVIGVPGEHVYSDGYVVYVNGEKIDEPYLSANEITTTFDKKLDSDEYWVLGDNRMYSKDSRSYGIFNKREILTHGIFIISPSNFGAK